MEAIRGAGKGSHSRTFRPCESIWPAICRPVQPAPTIATVSRRDAEGLIGEFEEDDFTGRVREFFEVDFGGYFGRKWVLEVKEWWILGSIGADGPDLRLTELADPL